MKRAVRIGLKSVGAILLLAVMAAGAWLFVHNWRYSGTVLGELRVGQPWLSSERNLYRLAVTGTPVGWVDEVDTWFIDNGYAYGTHQLEGVRPLAYFLFDCHANQFHSYVSEDDFKMALASHGLAWRNFMSGENVVRMKYNQRLFTNQCPPRNGP